MASRHGLSHYNNDGCRCAVCRDANNEYMRSYRRGYTVRPTAPTRYRKEPVECRLCLRAAPRYARGVCWNCYVTVQRLVRRGGLPSMAWTDFLCTGDARDIPV